MIATPYEDRLRLAGTLQLTGLDMRMDRIRVRATLNAGVRTLRGISPARVTEVWRGIRPCTPDGLPILGSSERIENVVFATGHAMKGLHLAPDTGSLVADLVTGEPPMRDLAPFSPDRFGSLGRAGRVNQDIIERCVAAMEDEDLDGIIAMSPENFAYVAGFIVPSQPILRWRHAAVVITRDGRRPCTRSTWRRPPCSRSSPARRPRLGGVRRGRDAGPRRPARRPRTGLGAGRDRDRLPAGPRHGATDGAAPGRALGARAPDLQPAPDDQDPARARAHATPRRHHRPVDQGGVRAASTPATPRWTSPAPSPRTCSAWGRRTTSGSSWPAASAASTRTSGPTTRMLERGDIVRLEVFGVLDGYHTGICRTAVVQEAPDERWPSGRTSSPAATSSSTRSVTARAGPRSMTRSRTGSGRSGGSR